MRTIGVVTGSRADYGIYQPLLRAIAADPALRLRLYVTGMHLSPAHGLTVTMIEQDGFTIAERIETLAGADGARDIAEAIGRGVLGFAEAFGRERPDLLVVLGDRFEMYAAALAALPFQIPCAHLHGGELTEGAIDDALRHSLTKLSHLHFVSAEPYAQRVRQLGEEPWRVTVSGALALDALDALDTVPLLTRAELEERFGLDLARPPLLVTFHPVTLEPEQAGAQADELLAALADAGWPVVFTAPNADTHASHVRRAIEDFVRQHEDARLVENFGAHGYFSMMARAAAMVGNSSSGIIEAASFKLPVVNIGTRQRGRVRGKNVIDTGGARAEVLAAIRQAVSAEFREKLTGLQNPYASRGKAAPVILERLKSAPLDSTLLRKRFHDFPAASPTA